MTKRIQHLQREVNHHKEQASVAPNHVLRAFHVSKAESFEFKIAQLTADYRRRGQLQTAMEFD